MSNPDDNLFADFDSDEGEGSEISAESLILDSTDETQVTDADEISEADLESILAQGSDTSLVDEGEVDNADDQVAAINDAFGSSSSEEEDADAGGEEDEEESILQIYSPDCLKCTHLVGQLGAKAFKKCHHTQGNEYCPAVNTRIIIGVPTDKIVAKIMDAEESGDMSKLAEIYAKLANKDPAVQSLVNQALAQARS